jgi:titin
LRAITTFTVTNTNNAGAGSLRQAIIDANATLNVGGNDIISFSGIGAGVQTITLTADLPTPTEPVTIDGYTAPGYVANAPAVVLDGATWGILFNNAAATGSIVNGIVFISATSGIEINGVNSITIRGCWFGINAAGAIPVGVPNRISFTGLYLVNSDNNIIGGTTAADRNIFSGCDFEGIFLSAGSDNNQVYGNYIGVGTGGNTDVGNGQRGVRIENSNNNLIGNGANTRNIISGNDNHGVLVLNSTGNLIASNYIGLGANGTTAIGNTIHGVIANAAPGTVVGGVTTAYRNVIGSNGGSGVSFENISSNSSILGNYLGTDATGILARANSLHGININNSTDCLVQGNLISGNLLSGVNVTVSSHRTTIRTNIIGLNLANAALGNGQHGIYLDASNNCVLGGAGWSDRNYCSSNGDAVGENGISIVNCNNHSIKNNFCGTDLTGIIIRANFDSGLSLSNSSGNTIGGATFLEKNVLSGNRVYGMYLYNVDNSTIQGNYIGTDSTGNIAMGNGHSAILPYAGIRTENSCDLLTFQSNVVSANITFGIELRDATNGFMYGNYIGVGADGITDLGNTSMGLWVVNSSGYTFGGTAANQRNIISGNGDHGFMLQGSSNNIIRGNYVGSDVTGLIAVPNQKSGIFTLDASNNNTIGGTLAGEGNLTCCSITEVGIRNQVSSNNTYYGNIVGLNINKAISAGFGNAEEGMLFAAYSGLFANSNIIGGLGAGQANTISQNGSDGVLIIDYGPSAGGINLNPIIGNVIYCNGGLGIDLNINIATENQGVAAPVITFRDANTISGTGTAGNAIHVYRNAYNDGSGRCDCEGEIYVGTTTVTGGGTWSLTHSLGLTVAQYNAVTATQTNTTNSTSEFASCVVPLPVVLLNFDGTVNSDGDAVLSWSSSLEVDFSHYTVIKSEDGIHFYELEIVPAKGSGNSYQFVDALFNGTAYYKLALVDNDAKVKFSSVIKVGVQSEVLMMPNPASTEVYLQGVSDEAEVNVLNAVGVHVLGNVGSKFSVENLAPGVYIVQINSENNTQNLKLIVE